ncbi:MAG: DUF814 domain-containing protein [Myxococcales bacterium]|nr:DUF814 domain-containing protein [Myxococcales bacterium]
MPRPSRRALAHLATELERALAGAFIDKVHVPEPRTLLLRIAGRSPERLLIDLEIGHPRVILTARWPETPKTPDHTTLLLRGALEGARVAAVRADDDRRLVLALTRGGGRRELVVQVAGRYHNAAVIAGEGAEEARLIAAIPGVDADAPALRDGPDPEEALTGRAFFTALDRRTWAEHDARAEGRAFDAVARRIARERKRLARLVAAAEGDLQRAADAEADRARGELLKTALGQVARGASEVTVTDWSREGAPEVVVPLDPALDARANMERYFKRYRRMARATPGIEARLLEHMEALEALDALAAAVSALRVGEDADGQRTTRLAELAAALPPEREQAPPSSRSADAPALPYREFRAADGAVILVGRGARHNDALTFKVARGNDLWLHARDVPGAHVILRVARGVEPAHEAILDAALLAAHHSEARDEGVVDVMWTERKHVRKAKGAAPGLVSVAASRNLAVRPDAARLERLYQSTRTLDHPA